MDDTLNLNRRTDQLDPNTLHDDGESAILTANRTLRMDPAGFGKSIPTFWPLGDLTRVGPGQCPDLSTIRPEATGPYLRHPATVYTPNDAVSAPTNFEHLAKFPENVRIGIEYDELPEVAGPVWITFPGHAQWHALAPSGTVRNLKGREAAVAYREHSGQPYHYTVLSYDARGRVEALLRYTENLGFDAVYYAYNSMNQVIRVTVADPLRRYSTWYGYDHNGRVDSVWTKLDGVGRGLWNSGTGVWAYPTQPLSRPNDAEITYLYSKTGQVDTMAYPKINVVTAYHYGPRKWLDTLIATQSGVDLFTQYLTFDDAGQITKQVSEHGTNGALVQDYTYDALGQLTAWRKDSGAVGDYGEEYVYDTVGNRTSTLYKPGGGVSGWTNNDIGRHLSAPEPNQLKEAKQYDALGTLQGSTLYFYDDNGAQTRRMHLDPMAIPQMDESFTWSTWRGLPSTYTRTDPTIPFGMANEWEWGYRYNAMGEREQKRQTLTPMLDTMAAEGYDWTYYLLSGNKQQLSVWKGLQTSDPTFCNIPAGSHVFMYPSEYLTYGSSTVAITQKPDNSKEYRVADHLGSNRVVLDNSSAVMSTSDYEPFGSLLASSSGDRKNWIDKEKDQESGYGNFGVRMYDFSQGRFSSIDPLWEKYASQSPYHYSHNSPLVYLDLNGDSVRFINENEMFLKRAKAAFKQALEHLESENTFAAELIRVFIDHPEWHINIKIPGPSGYDTENSYDHSERTINWDPSRGLEYTDKDGNSQIISPAVILGHEFGEAWLRHTLPNDYSMLPNYYTLKRQNTGEFQGPGTDLYIVRHIEGPAAVQLGEIPEGGERHIYSGETVETKGVDSNDPKF